jgi:hypothetical protein
MVGAFVLLQQGGCCGAYGFRTREGSGECADQMGAAPSVGAVGPSGIQRQRVVDQGAPVARQEAAQVGPGARARGEVEQGEEAGAASAVTPQIMASAAPPAPG